MSQKYLLSCASCGTAHTIETAQAGETIRCDCGANLDVPTLRGIRGLPLAPDDAPPESTWQPGYGLMFLGGLAIVFGLVVQAYLGATAPKVDPDRVRREAELLTPAASWDVWVMFQGGLPGQLSAGSAEALYARPIRRRWFFGSLVSMVGGAMVIYAGYHLLQKPQLERVET